MHAGCVQKGNTLSNSDNITQRYIMEEKGYVYILTNQAFRENWVKIGKSSRPVDVRSKELDNTAVPLPFEIYATMCTVKYAEAEKLVHKYIERFTDRRIRNNREFFNVKPEEALEIFYDVQLVIDDAEIEVFADMPQKKSGCKSKREQAPKKDQAEPVKQAEHLFYCKQGGCVAKGYMNGDEFIMLAGSEIRQNTRASITPAFAAQRQAFIVDHCKFQNGILMLKHDYTFSSPSYAAGRVLILSPWEYDAGKRHISRADCVALNGMAEEICNLSSITPNTIRQNNQESTIQE